MSLSLVLVLAACGDTTSSGDGGDSSAGGSSGSSMSGTGATSNALGKPQFGDPKIASIQRIAFGPGGVVLVGDGANDRIVAIETGDTDPSVEEDVTFTRINNVTKSVADAIGGDATPGEILIHDIAVNPLTKRVYIAAQGFSSPDPALLWMGGNGVAHKLDLSNVVYATVDYQAVQTPGSVVTDLAWLGEYVVASAVKQLNQASHFVMIETPFKHGASSERMSPRIYHPAAFQFVTELAIDRFFVFPGQFGEDWIGMTFTGAPVAKFEAAELFGGTEQQTGRTQFDYGIGRTVRDFVYYVDGSNEWLLAAIFNLQFDGLTVAARVHRDFLLEGTLIQGNAPTVFDQAGNALFEGVERVPEFDGADHMELVGDQIILYRQDTLLTMALPESP